MANKDHPYYVTWKRMRQRCNDTGAREYRHYGGRGIKICPAWDSFAVFLADMGPKPFESFVIDRIDNDGDYTPENCRWASSEESNYNRRQFKSNTSGVTGVCRNTRSGNWRASVSVKGQKVLVYNGPSFELACQARLNAEKGLYVA